jgi:hypothetical protein
VSDTSSEPAPARPWWPTIRLAAGIATTTTAIALGAMMLGEAHSHVGAALLAAGTFRGAWIVKEQFAWE